MHGGRNWFPICKQILLLYEVLCLGNDRTERRLRNSSVICKPNYAMSSSNILLYIYDIPLRFKKMPFKSYFNLQLMHNVPSLFTNRTYLQNIVTDECL